MKHRWYHYLRIPFTFLTLLVQLAITPFYKPGRIRFRAGCLEIVDDTPGSLETAIIGNPGGQTFGGRLIWYNMALFVERRITPVHERDHVHMAELVNTIAHVIIVPPSVILSSEWGWWIIAAAVALAQAAFAISYGAHFMWEWAKLGFKRWREAYMKIWAERRAYRIDDEYEQGKRPEAWGA